MKTITARQEATTPEITWLVESERIAAVEVEGLRMSVPLWIPFHRSTDGSVVRDQALTKPEIIKSAQELCFIKYALMDSGMADYFHLTNMLVLPPTELTENDEDSFFALFERNSGINVHAIAVERRRVMKALHLFKSKENNSKTKTSFHRELYAKDYSLNEQKTVFSLFTYDKQTRIVHDVDKIIHFNVMYGSQEVLGRVLDPDAVITLEQERPTEEATMSSGELVSALAKLRNIATAHLKSAGLEATEKNVTAYIDYACVLRADINFLVFAVEIHKMLVADEPNPKFDYITMFTGFIVNGWSPEFLMLLRLENIKITSIQQLNGLRDIWESSPDDWFFKFLLESR